MFEGLTFFKKNSKPKLRSFPQFILTLVTASWLGLQGSSIAQIQAFSITESESTLNLVASNSDLLQTSLSSQTWPNESLINNGSTGDFNTDSAVDPAFPVPPSTYDFNLDLTLSPEGYDIENLRCFSGWTDEAAGQSYTLYFSHVGDPSFIQVGPPVNAAASGDRLVTSLLDLSGAPLGSQVDVVRFVVSANVQDNIWREIDVFGTPSPPATSFSANPSSIEPGAPVTISWDLSVSGTIINIETTAGLRVGNFFSGGPGSFTLSQSPTETTTYILDYRNFLGLTGTHTTTVTVGNKPTINSLTLNTTHLALGESALLTWEVEDETTLLLNGIDVSGQTSASVSPTRDTNYTLVAINDFGSSEQSLPVIVLSEGGEPRIDSFASSSASIFEGDEISLSWEVEGESTLLLNGIDVSNQSNALVSPLENTTYTLTATNLAGSSEQSLTVLVEQKPEIVSFTQGSAFISSGAQASLAWEVDGESTLLLNGVNVTGQTSALVSPSEDTTYTLTATNLAGISVQSLTVLVVDEPSITSFTQSATFTTPGGPVTLSWVVEHESTVLLNGADVSGQTSITVNPSADTTYTLTIGNLAGSSEQSLTVSVLPEPSIVSFASSSDSIYLGEEITLSWEVQNDATLLLNGSNVSGQTSASFSPHQDTTYTLTATNPVGTSELSLTVLAVAAPQIISFDQSSAFTLPGGEIALSWEVEDETTLLLNGVDVLGQTSALFDLAEDTTYTLTASNPAGTSEQSLPVFILDGEDFRISEFLAENRSSLADEDGDFSDWIEIHNPTASESSLAGYFLTDDPSDLQKWSFPSTILGAGEFLVVFASGKDRTLASSELHTNFSLASSGEYLALVRPDGQTIVTEFAPEFPPQVEEISYGYDFTTDSYRYFEAPLPGAVNLGTSYQGFVADTKFSVDRGFYQSAFLVAITSETNGTLIRYTLDGSEPTESNGEDYSTPLSITETTILRAAAFKAEMRPSNVDTQSYIFPADVITQPTMDAGVTNDPTYGPQLLDSLASIPSISLAFDGDEIDYDEVPLSVELLNFETEATQVDAGVVRYGGYFTLYDKSSVRLHFRSQYGSSRLNFPLFNNRHYTLPPVESFDSLDLRAGNHDMVSRGAYLGNPFADDAMIDMGHVAPHGRFAHLYWNGEYRGMYHLRERWDADMLSSYLPGEEEEYDTINANNRGSNFLTGDLQDGDLDDWNEIQDRLVSEPRFEQVKEMLDLNNLIDFMLLFTSGYCESEFRAGGSVSNGVGFKFFLKDADGYLRDSFYSVTHSGPLDTIRLLREEGHPDFIALLGDRVHKQLFNGGPLTQEGNSDRLLRRMNESRLAFLSEYARWPIVTAKSAFTGTPFGSYNRTPEAWVDYNLVSLNDRFPSLTDNQIQDLKDADMYPSLTAVSYSQHGGSLGANGDLTLSVPSNASKVYYLFGPEDTDPDNYRHSLDPRLEGGLVNPQASELTQSTEIQLTEPGWVLSRSYDEATGEWSALNEAYFTLTTVPADASNLVVSKIHFNPADPTGSELAVATDADEFEFLELMNVGSETIELSGVTISNAIEFTFDGSQELAPGERVLVTENREAFEVRYASLLPSLIFGSDAAGESDYGGKLSNGGERITITDAFGNQILDFSYGDDLPWPTSSDGEGYALVLMNPNSSPNPSVASHWAASAEIGGAPGIDSATGFQGDPDADADGDGLTALLEYALGSSDNQSDDSTLEAGFGDFLIGGQVETYLTVTFHRNQHGLNAVYIMPQVSEDLETWTTIPDITFVSDTDNGDGTATAIYRSSQPVGATASEKEFIRVIVTVATSP